MVETNVDDIKFLADLMDRKFKGPFGFRFGLDGLIGLIPGLGDMLTNSVSIYILVRAFQLGVSTSILFRMGINILVENLVDIIPLLGNIFDFFWQSNSKNLDLLQDYLKKPSKATTSAQVFSSIIVIGFFMLTLGSLITSIYILSLVLGR